MQNEQQNFEATAVVAEDKLSDSLRRIENSMKGLDVEKFETMKEKAMVKIISLIVAKVNDENWRDFYSPLEKIDILKMEISPLLSDFPVESINEILSQILLAKEIKEAYEYNSAYVGYIASAIFCLCKRTQENEHDDVDTEQTHEIIVSGEIFKNKAFMDSFGTGMPKGVKVRYEGDCGFAVGKLMIGGELTVSGSVEGHVAHAMKEGKITIEGGIMDYGGCDMEGGTLLVKGSAGRKCGTEMKGGKLIFEKGVISFGNSAFTNRNKGIIILQGVTIWDNGWTTEGLRMKNKGLIKIERDR